MLMKSFGRRILLLLNKQKPAYSRLQCSAQNCRTKPPEVPPWPQVSVRGQTSFVIPWKPPQANWFALFPTQGHAHGRKWNRVNGTKRNFWTQQGRKNGALWVCWFNNNFCSWEQSCRYLELTQPLSRTHPTFWPASHSHKTSPQIKISRLPTPQAEGRRCTWWSTTEDYQSPQQSLRNRAVGHWIQTNSFWQCFCHSWGKRTGPANSWIILYYVLLAWPAPLTASSWPHENHVHHTRPSRNWPFFCSMTGKILCASINKMPANCRGS